MGRKKATAENEEVEDVISDDNFGQDIVRKSISKLYGANVLKSGTEFLASPRTLIPISPAFDRGTGGFYSGSFVVVSGKQKCGKTVCMLDFCATAQKPEYGGRKIYFGNVEGRLGERELRGIEGLDLSPDKFETIASSKGQILTLQDYLTIFKDIIYNVPGAVLLIDSMSMLCDQAEMVAEQGKTVMVPGHKAVSMWVRQCAQAVLANDCIVISIVQMMKDPSPYSPAIVPKLNSQLGHQMSNHLQVMKADDWKEDDKQIGLKMKWKSHCSPIRAPNQEFESYFRFGKGIDRVAEIHETALLLGLIVKGGSWFTHNYLDDPERFQGQNDSMLFLQENPDMYNKLNQQVEEMLS